MATPVPRRDRPARLVLLGPCAPWRGGIAQHTAAWASALHAAGHQVTLLNYRRLYPAFLYPGRDPRDPDGALSRPPPDVPQRAIMRPLWPPSWWAAVRYAVDCGAQVVLIQWWVPFFGPAAAATAFLLRRRGLRVAFICHNVLPHDGGGLLDRMLVRWALARADSWIVHASSDAAALVRVLGLRRVAGKVVRVPMPTASLPAVAEGGPAPGAARAALGLPADAPLALFFGFVRPYKGVEVLIDALPRVLERLPDLRVVVAGEFWTAPGDLRARAADLGVEGAVRLDPGYVPDDKVWLYMAAADVVVLPYREATQSAVVPLAEAAGKAVIATQVGGLPEAVDHGRSGLLVPPDDAEALAEALLRYFREPGLAARLSHGAAARAERSVAPELSAAVQRVAAWGSARGVVGAKGHAHGECAR